MARQQQVQSENTTYDFTTEIDRELQERQLQERMVKLDQRMESVLSKYLEFEALYGENDYRTTLMKSVLETAVAMRDIINTLSGIKEAFSYMFEAMDIVDLTFNIFQEGLLSSTKANYGFFARMKQKRQIRKAIKNNVNRMSQITTMMGAMQNIADTTVMAIAKSSRKMQTAMTKRNKKLNKKNGGTSTPTDGTPSAVDQMIARAKEERGMPTNTTTTTTETTTTKKPSGGSSSSGEINVDDII